MKLSLVKIKKGKKILNWAQLCTVQRGTVEKKRREGECLTLPLSLLKKQEPYLFLQVVLANKSGLGQWL